MADTFLLEIVTPTRLFLSEQVEEMTAPGSEGEFGVLAGHAAFLTSLKEGELTYKKGKDTKRITIDAGYAEVIHEKVTILTENIKE
ncbi:MAG: ATP synthase F1 subunit epsilon [Deltaproteobacteria bacterium]|nr:ATP synthase F1 subunit epsilon [Deltaproteobacteria bacterium]